MIAAQDSSPQQATTRVFNLTFHGIGTPDRPLSPGEESYWTSARTLSQLVDAALEWRDTTITFDDGNLSDLTESLPILLSKGATATFFVVAGRIGQKGFLDRNQLLELLAAGMKIGSHGMNHRPWRKMPRAELISEISDSRSQLEDLLGIPVTQAACPFGAYGRSALSLLSKAGYSRVFTSDRGWARSDAWLQPRNTVTRSTTLDSVKRAREERWTARCVRAVKMTGKGLLF